MFDRLIKGMVQFFQTGQIMVDKKETIWVAEILEAAAKAEQQPGQWVAIQ